MNTFTAPAPMLPTVTFRRVAVVLSVLVAALYIYIGSLFDPLDNGGANKVSASEIGAMENQPREARATEIGTVKVSSSEIGSMENGAPEVGVI